jgi:RNA polymerase sigma factor (sigma-70 family)
MAAPSAASERFADRKYVLLTDSMLCRDAVAVNQSDPHPRLTRFPPILPLYVCGTSNRTKARVVELAATELANRDVSVDALHEHGPVLLAAARVIALDDDEAQDIVQATFEIALRRLHTLREPTALRSWLLRIEAREAFRMVRRLRRRVRLDLERHDKAGSPSDIDARADVRAALARLPPRTRAAVAVHYLGGLSVRETAEVLGVSENTIKSQLQAGLRRLREDLGDE